MKKMQTLTVWLLPLIIIGGFFIPALGYLVIAMMAILLALSFFKGRYWCWNLCPRGAFLDIVLSKVSPNKPIPKIFLKQTFRWLVLIIFSAFLALRLGRTAGNWLAIGMVFVSMCLITTVISILLGVFSKHRAWCFICPMGTLQGAFRKNKIPAKKIISKKS
ncbi:MAG: 4Fe-4S binding protein [Candidatus Omnitrophota bacterium]